VQQAECVGDCVNVEQAGSGTAKAVGNADILAQIAQTLVTFQIGFEVLPGTAAPAKEVDLNPYSVAEYSVFMSGE
jgi:hypothetical protein